MRSHGRVKRIDGFASKTLGRFDPFILGIRSFLGGSLAPKEDTSEKIRPVHV